jgi:HK97 family phage major capsid protein
MPSPYQVEQLLRDEESIARRRLQYASELDAAHDARLQRRHLLAQMTAVGNPKSPLLPTVANLSVHEREKYSLVAALQSQLSPSKEVTLEKEVSWSIEKDIGQVANHGGVWIPLRLTMSGLDTKSDAAGGYLTTPKVPQIIDFLTNQSRVLEMGAKFVSGLKYSQQFPVELAAPEATWVNENPGSDVAQTDASFGARTVTPHPLQSTTSISKQLLQQASQSLEGWLRARIARAHALAIDRAAIFGQGVENQPVGLLLTEKIGDVAAGTNGAAVTAAMILSMEATIGTANADSAACAWLTRPEQRTKLRAVLELTSGGLPLWRNGRMLDYPAYVSNQVPSTLVKGNTSDNTAIIFGDWSQLLVAEFDAAIEVTLDPYSSKKKGVTELASYGSYDVLALQPTAFVAIQDAR